MYLENQIIVLYVLIQTTCTFFLVNDIDTVKQELCYSYFGFQCALFAQWFEEKQQQIETLDQQLKKLHQCVETLVIQRKGMYHRNSSWCTSKGHWGTSNVVRSKFGTLSLPFH